MSIARDTLIDVSMLLLWVLLFLKQEVFSIEWWVTVVGLVVSIKVIWIDYKGEKNV